MTTLHIYATPTVSAYTGRVETKWCFGCCQRTEHRLVIVLDCSGWHEPTGWWRCPLCRDDCTAFGAGKAYSIRRQEQEIMPLEVALGEQMKAVQANIASERSEAR